MRRQCTALGTDLGPTKNGKRSNASPVHSMVIWLAQLRIACLCRRTTHLMMLALLLDELGDHARPASLVARAHARAGVAVEILVEWHVVAPVRVVLEVRLAAKHRPPPI